MSRKGLLDNFLRNLNTVTNKVHSFHVRIYTLSNTHFSFFAAQTQQEQTVNNRVDPKTEIALNC